MATLRSLRTAPGRTRSGSWLARFGVGGFLFFLVKGLAWLLLPALWAVAR